MLRLFVLAIVLSACVADREAQASSQYQIHKDDHHRENHRLRQDLDRLRHELKISRNPHSHLDDPYRDGPRDDDKRRNDNRREGHDSRHVGHDNRRDDHDNRRDDHDRWTKHEKIWWTDKDRIEHEDDDRDIRGPVIFRTITTHKDHHKPDIARQNKIIKEVYSPDYAQPTWTIDYRYLKTGGRDYTRSLGGQIMVLPHGIRTNEHKEFKNYDELIDNLRERRLAERAKPQYFMPLGQEIHNDRHDDDRWYH